MAKVTGKGSQLYITEQVADTGAITFESKSRVGAVTSIGETGWSVEEITYSTLDDQSEGVLAYPGDVDFGSISFECYLDDETQFTRLNGLRGKMIQVGIFTENSAAASVKFRGFLTSLKISERTKSDMLMVSGEVRVSGALEQMTASDITGTVQTFATKTVKE